MNLLDKIDAVWYDSDNPSQRTIAVRLAKGKLTLMTRDNPTDVWSPPKQLLLKGISEQTGRPV